MTRHIQQSTTKLAKRRQEEVRRLDELAEKMGTVTAVADIKAVEKEVFREAGGPRGRRSSAGIINATTKAQTHEAKERAKLTRQALQRHSGTIMSRGMSNFERRHARRTPANHPNIVVVIYHLTVTLQTACTCPSPSSRRHCIERGCRWPRSTRTRSRL